jgi:single-stranded-DNA-specific exonuclease
MAEIKNLKKLAKRILRAIQNKEGIILYGDSDLDGAVAVIIMKEVIANLSGNPPVIYFCDRKREEHGVNKAALNYLKDKAPCLLLALDCGIGSFAEAEIAQELGFELVILDHHEILGELPKAQIIVDPKQEKAKDNPFYDLATAGLAFKLAELLMAEKFSRSIREDMLELTALATLADMVPETGENEEILQEGLPLLENSWRPGIKILFNSSVVKNCQSTREIIQKIIFIVNLTNKEGDLSEVYLLLVAISKEEAQLRFERFLQKGAERQVEIEKLTNELKNRIFIQNKEIIIFEGGKDWPFPLLGAAGSRMSVFFGKPAFVFKRDENEIRGEYRMPDEESGIKALESCQSLVKKYGGHPKAGGFVAERGNEEKLKQCLVDFFESSRKKKRTAKDIARG